MSFSDPTTQIPLAVAAAVYLAKVAIETAQHVRQSTNGGTHHDKVLRKLGEIAQNTEVTRTQMREFRRENTEAHREARDTQRVVAQALTTLGSAVDRNVSAIEGQNRLLERLVDSALRHPNGGGGT